MIIIVHNLTDDSQKTYKGDKHSISRALDHDFRFLRLHFGPDELADAIEYLDAQQSYAVEVIDENRHPFEDKAYAQ
jgi:hypothetical protein